MMLRSMLAVLVILLFSVWDMQAQNLANTPPELLPITVENAHQLEFLGNIDSPVISDLFWSHQGHLAAASDSRGGVRLYRREDLKSHTQEPAYRFLPLPMGYSLVVDDRINFSPDDRLLVTLSFCCDFDGGLIQIWDTATGQLKAEKYHDNRSMIRRNRISPDSRYILYTVTDFNNESHLYLMDATTTITLGHAVMDASQAYQSFDFSPDSKLVAAGSFDGSVWLYETPALKLVQGVLPPAPDRYVYQVVFSPDGQFLAVPAQNYMLIVNLETGMHETIPIENPYHLTFSPDGSLLAFTSGQYSTSSVVGVYDVEARRIRNLVPGEAPLVFIDEGLVFKLPDNVQQFLMRDAVMIEPLPDSIADKYLSLTPIYKEFPLYYQQLSPQPYRTTSYFNRVAFHPFENMLYVTAPPRLISLENAAEPVSVDYPEVLDASDLPLFTPDGRYILAGGKSDWNTARGGWSIMDTKIDPSAGITGFVGDLVCCHTRYSTITDIALSADGKQIATVDGDDMLRIWDMDTVLNLKFIQNDMGHERYRAENQPVRDLEFTPAGNLALLIIGSIRIVDTTTGELMRTIPVSETDFGFAVSPNGRELAAGSGIYDLVTGKQLIALNRNYIPQVSFSADGSILTLVNHMQFFIHDAKTGAVLFTSPNQAAVTTSDSYLTLAMSHDQTLLVTAGLSNGIRLWGVKAQ